MVLYGVLGQKRHLYGKYGLYGKIYILIYNNRIFLCINFFLHIYALCIFPPKCEHLNGGMGIFVVQGD